MDNLVNIRAALILFIIGIQIDRGGNGTVRTLDRQTVQGNTVIFRERPEVNCIVHTHSKFATAVSAMDGVEKVPVIDIEGVVYLGGEILVAPFAPPGSGELAAHVRNTIGTNAGLLMASHGAIGTGLTMEDAMISSDNVERACEMYLAILGAGRQVRKLPEDYMEMAKKKSLVRRNVVL